MAEPKLSTFIVGLIWISFFAVIFGTYLANLSSNYGVNYDENNTDVYDKLDELNTRAESYQEKSAIESDTNLLDTVGGYFSAGYKALRLAFDSFDVFSSMTDNAMKSEYTNTVAGHALKTALVATVIILIVIGVLLRAIVKQWV